MPGARETPEEAGERFTSRPALPGIASPGGPDIRLYGESRLLLYNLHPLLWR